MTTSTKTNDTTTIMFVASKLANAQQAVIGLRNRIASTAEDGSANSLIRQASLLRDAEVALSWWTQANDGVQWATTNPGARSARDVLSDITESAIESVTTSGRDSGQWRDETLTGILEFIANARDVLAQSESK